MVLASFLAACLLQTSDLPRRGTLGLAFTALPPARAAEASLPAGEGLIAGPPVANLTAARAGLREGDVVVKINDRAARPQGLGEWVRSIPVGGEVTFKVIRDGRSLDLAAPLQEKPRDPGNANYKVSYRHVVSNGDRMRTIITQPTKPGRHPALLFIQGLSPVSYDFTLEGSKGDVATIDGPLLFDLANSDIITLRIEKPGVGDSEGGPYTAMDYTTELDIYRQAMKQLREIPNVDLDNVFIFGHSMGGSFGPMIACEFPVKGLAVYGTAGRTWFEYFMDIMRYQGLVGGESYEAADDNVRASAQIMALAIFEKKSPEEIKKSHPPLAPLVDGYFPGGLFNGKNLDFWRQLNETNFARYWAKCGSHVLAVRGSADFVTYDADHMTIAAAVNQVRPGFGKFINEPNSDHLFHRFATEQESMKNFQFGQFNNSFAKTLKDWMAEVMASDKSTP